MNKALLLFACLVLPGAALAKGSIGLAADVAVDGVFSPEIVTFTIKSVDADSPADKAGIMVGQQVLAIDGCKIPGCPARMAKKLMAKAPGEALPLRVKKADGSEALITIVLE